MNKIHSYIKKSRYLQVSDASFNNNSHVHTVKIFTQNFDHWKVNKNHNKTHFTTVRCNIKKEKKLGTLETKKKAKKKKKGKKNEN